MKALRFKLFATMITLAAVILISTTPANAQRSSSERENNTRETRSKSDQTNRIEKKSTFKNNDKVDRNRVNRDLTTKRNSPAQVKPRTETNKSVGKENKGNTSSSRNVQKTNGVERKTNQNTQRSEVGQRNIPNQSQQSRSVDAEIRNGRDASARVSPNSESRRNSYRAVSNNRDFYRTDANDRRYTPSREYNGRNEYWNGRNRPGDMTYNNRGRDYYSSHNYYNHKHWDRSWEHYRWNYSSWRDYYSGYNPRSFVYYKYYYHHPYYGHVIRRFDFRPMVLVHNHHKYYCYDGHFFRYRSGIGYVMVDLPFGFTFEMIPTAYYERVYINGYLYFRVGNLFFESSAYGFSLVHFPDRYYAWDNSYERQGYLFDDDYY